MATTMTPREKTIFKAAFLLGFKASREGFNAECPYEHLAPGSIFQLIYCHTDSMAEFEEMMNAMPEFVQLQNEAMASFDK